MISNIFSLSQKIKPRIISDLRYVAGSTLSSHTLDLYLPPMHSGEPVPLIVWIHGGAWIWGDKANCPAKYYMPPGYAVASINYRRSFEASFPAPIHDCRAAIRWLRANGAQYGIDSERIGVWGNSAGAYLASFLGMHTDEHEGELGEHAGVSSRVQAVAAWATPSNFTTINQAYKYNDEKARESFVGKLLNGDVSHASLKNASPVSFVSPKAAPFHVVHGKLDPVVPVEQGHQLFSALKQHGVETSLHIDPICGHDIFTPRAISTTLEFFNRHLKKRSSENSAVGIIPGASSDADSKFS